jgi:hypothetical protein
MGKVQEKEQGYYKRHEQKEGCRFATTLLDTI